MATCRSERSIPKRVTFKNEDTDQQDRQRKELEEELEQLTDAMDQLRAEIETKETQKRLVSNLTSPATATAHACRRYGGARTGLVEADRVDRHQHERSSRRNHQDAHCDA